ncbi:Bifunctional protein folD 2 [Includes: Methylenetetrahydrofolate dehydrogenase; Methenyltetrahydrofolate cyclohydrolase] [Pseudorhizobium banfieldiae]|uniref:Bifunctional protein FolD n=1 Tax=Pseudorhizobium banfieldiae TaxID=1125847 RepID=L0NCB9_9HYPH|nr:bifunctional methylenetetrahydrofolate dehydrogenase/methenyltetrahydrofolate cyclohydrolase FolD [Pseudorhizobium banfieldiae]CAD6599366.1 bifunctional methylenetetrahydrofolate dehydrogenase/methenyltetrahydrofolate cyclohydrolase FolD protein [arsenite-oxidising bacterium NT-25]CCF17977.1 Bifunctional protein folD 2 [Includes: Methylenetetrahydrofolate dehydrogenase; Methenyltetrahydrofolate cyclohydrolase] [Pseudorhizobium banfieldiae]
MATIIDGKVAAQSVIETVTRAAAALESGVGVKPGLAVVIVGNDPASHAYVNSKSKMAKQCGFNSVQHSLPEETTQEELEKLVSELNADPAIHGILVQLPLPKHLKSEPVIQSIAPEKDVDGLNVVNAGKLATGDLASGLISCTPAGALILINKIHGADLSGLNAVVIGRSNLFGKPMAMLLLSSNATVTMAHSRSKDLPGICRQADILVAAVGRPHMVRAGWVKPGATVVDVGINRVPAPEKGEGKTKITGDVAYEECAAVAGAITPVPGGVGPMTIAMLMANTVVAACRTFGRPIPKF